MKNVNKKPILVTSGEPAGIGPDIVLMYAALELDTLTPPWVVLGCLNMLKKRAKMLNLSINFKEYQENIYPTPQKNTLMVWDVPLHVPCEPGVLNAHNANYVLKLLELGGRACLQGYFSALVTAPVHKGIIADSGIEFSGHTEYFADLAGVSEVVMLMSSPKLRVALVTTHLPLREVPDAITSDKISRVTSIISDDFERYFNLPNPKIYVCGLNPHAGEGGHLGREEIEIIEPTLNNLKAKGFNVHGPYPADSLFTASFLDKADVFLAMYHDQGLGVLKYAAFDTAVNITLGLPFIRTSVDHGTALDLAGTGQCAITSFAHAMESAQIMSENSQSHKK